MDGLDKLSQLKGKNEIIVEIENSEEMIERTLFKLIEITKIVEQENLHPIVIFKGLEERFDKLTNVLREYAANMYRWGDGDTILIKLNFMGKSEEPIIFSEHEIAK